MSSSRTARAAHSDDSRGHGGAIVLHHGATGRAYSPVRHIGRRILEWRWQRGRMRALTSPMVLFDQAKDLA